MPLPKKKLIFHWPVYGDNDEPNGKTMCGIDSANEPVEFVFSNEFHDAIEAELKLPAANMSDIMCEACDENMEWMEVDDGDDSSSEE